MDPISAYTDLWAIYLCFCEIKMGSRYQMLLGWAKPETQSRGQIQGQTWQDINFPFYPLCSPQSLHARPSCMNLGWEARMSFKTFWRKVKENKRHQLCGHFLTLSWLANQMRLASHPPISLDVVVFNPHQAHRDWVLDNEIWRLRPKLTELWQFSILFQNKMKCEIDVLKKRSKRSVKFGHRGESSNTQYNSCLSIKRICISKIILCLSFFEVLTSASQLDATRSENGKEWRGRNKSFIILDASLDLPQCPGVTIISQWEARIRPEWPISGQETTDLWWHDAGKLITCPYLLLKPILENVDYLCPTLRISVCFVCGVPSTPSQPQARNLRNIFGP